MLFCQERTGGFDDSSRLTNNGKANNTRSLACEGTPHSVSLRAPSPFVCLPFGLIAKTKRKKNEAGRIALAHAGIRHAQVRSDYCTHATTQIHAIFFRSWCSTRQTHHAPPPPHPHPFPPKENRPTRMPSFDPCCRWVSVGRRHFSLNAKQISKTKAKNPPPVSTQPLILQQSTSPSSGKGLLCRPASVSFFFTASIFHSVPEGRRYFTLSPMQNRTKRTKRRGGLEEEDDPKNKQTNTQTPKQTNKSTQQYLPPPRTLPSSTPTPQLENIDSNPSNPASLTAGWWTKLPIPQTHVSNGTSRKRAFHPLPRTFFPFSPHTLCPHPLTRVEHSNRWEYVQSRNPTLSHHPGNGRDDSCCRGGEA